MSLWVDGEKKNGKQPLYSIGGLDPFSMLFGGSLVAMMLVPLLALLVRALRNLLQ